MMVGLLKRANSQFERGTSEQLWDADDHLVFNLYQISARYQYNTFKRACRRSKQDLVASFLGKIRKAKSSRAVLSLSRASNFLHSAACLPMQLDARLPTYDENVSMFLHLDDDSSSFREFFPGHLLALRRLELSDQAGYTSRPVKTC